MPKTMKIKNLPVASPTKRKPRNHVTPPGDRNMITLSAHVVHCQSSACAPARQNKDRPHLHCRSCNFVAGATRSLMRHFRQKHLAKGDRDRLSATYYDCRRCPFMATSKSIMAKHVKKNHAVDTESYPCEECPTVFNSKYYMVRHTIYNHGSIECPYCPIKVKSVIDRFDHMEEKHFGAMYADCQDWTVCLGRPQDLQGVIRAETDEADDELMTEKYKKKLAELKLEAAKEPESENEDNIESEGEVEYSDDEEVREQKGRSPRSNWFDERDDNGEKKCRSCGKSCFTRRKLDRHLRVRHRISLCQYCGVETAVSKNALLEHICVAHPETNAGIMALTDRRIEEEDRSGKFVEQELDLAQLQGEHAKKVKKVQELMEKAEDQIDKKNKDKDEGINSGEESSSRTSSPPHTNHSEDTSGVASGDGASPPHDSGNSSPVTSPWKEDDSCGHCCDENFPDKDSFKDHVVTKHLKQKKLRVSLRKVENDKSRSVRKLFKAAALGQRKSMRIKRMSEEPQPAAKKARRADTAVEEEDFEELSYQCKHCPLGFNNLASFMKHTKERVRNKSCM